MEIQDRTWKKKLAAVQPRLKAMTMKTNDRMRGNPAKWAGIAAGAGLGVGLIGRFLQRRSRQHQHMPAVVIIEAAR